MYKIYFKSITMDGISQDLQLDDYLLFRNTDLFEVTENLSEADIIMSDEFFCDEDYEVHRDKNTDLIAELNNPILIFADSIYHVEESMGPSIDRIKLVDRLSKNKNLPFRKILATHCNDWVKKHLLFSPHRPDFQEQLDKNNICITEVPSLRKTLKENFILCDYLFDLSYATHFDFDLMQRLFETVPLNSHWWYNSPYHEDYHVSKFDIEKFSLSEDNDIINPALVEAGIFLSNHKGTKMTQFLKPKEKDSSRYQVDNSLSEPTSDGVKIFVSPTRTVYKNARGYCRRKLIEVLTGYPGYIGDSSRSVPLFSNTGNKMTDHEVLGYNAWGMSPPHNAYYNTSSISFYVETCCYMDSVSPLMTATEKTWTPILKGHFIMPYGAPGFCGYLRDNYDIRFPDFIDLSYDSISDDESRLKAYLTEVERICEMGGSKLYILKNQNLDLLIHNRDVFRKNGYKDHLSEYFISNKKNLLQNQ